MSISEQQKAFCEIVSFGTGIEYNHEGLFDELKKFLSEALYNKLSDMSILKLCFYIDVSSTYDNDYERFSKIFEIYKSIILSYPGERIKLSFILSGRIKDTNEEN